MNRLCAPCPGDQVILWSSLVLTTSFPSCPPLMWASDIQKHHWNPLMSFACAHPCPPVKALAYEFFFLSPSLCTPPCLKEATHWLFLPCGPLPCLPPSRTCGWNQSLTFIPLLGLLHQVHTGLITNKNSLLVTVNSLQRTYVWPPQPNCFCCM